MNDTERRLTRELDQAAAARIVDVDRLWEQVQARAVDEINPRDNRRLAPYLAAAAVAVVLVVTAALLADGNRSSGPVTTPEVSPSRPVEGPRPAVVGDWACPQRRAITPGTNSVTGRPVRAVLDPSAAPPEAVAYGVPKYQFTFTATAGTLDYGDDAGRRIARTELTRTPDGWLVGRRTVCSGPAGRPSPDLAALGRYTSSPVPLDPQSAQVSANPPVGDPVLIDDRTYYDATGMLRHRSLYAYLTDEGYDFASMPSDNSLSTGSQKEDTIVAVGLAPQAGTNDTFVFGAHDLVGRVFALLTKNRAVEGLTSRDAATGAPGTAQQFALPDGRTLYTVVPATPGGTDVTVHRTTGDDPPRRF